MRVYPSDSDHLYSTVHFQSTIVSSHANDYSLVGVGFHLMGILRFYRRQRRLQFPRRQTPIRKCKFKLRPHKRWQRITLLKILRNGYIKFEAIHCFHLFSKSFFQNRFFALFNFILDNVDSSRNSSLMLTLCR